ncbi:MAG: hypothetical protein ACK4FN_01510 [Acinetobacter johnsonii]
MNLIEQLGGYEWAKIIQGSREMGGLPADLDLEDALLEYRRQHNIFEVGDRVVLLKNQHMWHKMESIYTVTSTDIYDGITIGVAIEYKNTSHGNEIGNIRHATDAEIEAGKRLEVKSEN